MAPVFSQHTQQVLALARKEAERLNHDFVGTEHILLAIIKLGQGEAFKALKNLGAAPDSVRMGIEKLVGVGPEPQRISFGVRQAETWASRAQRAFEHILVIDQIPYTPRVKAVLALAAEEAQNLNSKQVGTEHILLGLLRNGGGVAAKVLNEYTTIR